MARKKTVMESAYKRDVDDRNDIKWAHPELKDWWIAGDADFMDTVLDDTVPLDERKKLLESRMKETIAMYKRQGLDVWKGLDYKEDGSDYGHLERFYIKGCPEDPEADCSVSVLIPNEKSDKPKPVIFYIMSGALYTQAPETNNEILRFAKKFNCVTVVPDYCTPLEDVYPTQINQIHAGYQWMVEHAEELNIDPDNVTIFGESTGAHLGLCTAFRLKRYGYSPRGCIINDPMVDDRNYFESCKIIKKPCDATRAHAMYASYVGWVNLATNFLGPEAFANHATVEECKGLCPIFLNVGESDQDRDATIEFAKKLYEARVPCSLHVWEGASHATLYYARKTGMARRFWDNVYGDIQCCMDYDMRRPWAWDESCPSRK